jgi:hypothetical protein
MPRYLLKLSIEIEIKADGFVLAEHSAKSLQDSLKNFGFTLKLRALNLYDPFRLYPVSLPTLLESDVVSCYICSRREVREDAIEEGWLPYFYDVSDIERGPCCPTCQATFLKKSESDGEWVARKEMFY